jgi:hypothetical protein
VASHAFHRESRQQPFPTGPDEQIAFVTRFQGHLRDTAPHQPARRAPCARHVMDTNPCQRLGLAGIRADQVQQPQKPVVPKAAGWRGIQDHERTGFLSETRSLHDGGGGNFKLHQDDTHPVEAAECGADFPGRQPTVRAGDDEDLLLTTLPYHDHCRAGGCPGVA